MNNKEVRKYLSENLENLGYEIGVEEYLKDLLELLQEDKISVHFVEMHILKMIQKNKELTEEKNQDEIDFLNLMINDK